jgi:hypothetical protein
MEPARIEKRQMTLLGFSFFGWPFEISGGWTEENEPGEQNGRAETRKDHLSHTPFLPHPPSVI